MKLFLIFLGFAFGSDIAENVIFVKHFDPTPKLREFNCLMNEHVLITPQMHNQTCGTLFPVPGQESKMKGFDTGVIRNAKDFEFLTFSVSATSFVDMIQAVTPSQEKFTSVLFEGRCNDDSKLTSDHIAHISAMKLDVTTAEGAEICEAVCDLNNNVPGIQAATCGPILSVNEFSADIDLNFALILYVTEEYFASVILHSSTQEVLDMISDHVVDDKWISGNMKHNWYDDYDFDSIPPMETSPPAVPSPPTPSDSCCTGDAPCTNIQTSSVCEGRSECSWQCGNGSDVTLNAGVGSGSVAKK